MMKIYPQNLVKSIQTIIDSGKVEISTFNSYDEFIPEINSCEIHIKFTKNSKVIVNLLLWLIIVILHLNLSIVGEHLPQVNLCVKIIAKIKKILLVILYIM